MTEHNNTWAEAEMTSDLRAEREQAEREQTEHAHAFYARVTLGDYTYRRCACGSFTADRIIDQD